MKIVIEKKENYKEQCKEASILLDECLHLLNQIPNRRYRPKSSKNTYELASKIQNYLK